MRNLIDDAGASHAASEMRGRLYDLMAQFGDPYAAAGKPVHGGEPPNRYGAARYLSRA
jgi:hypothetical protein